VLIPQAAGLGGGSAVVHVDGASGAVDLVDGCRPLEATAAWVTAKARWGSDATDVYADAAQHAHGPLRASVRALSLGDSLDLRSGVRDASTAGPVAQRRLFPQDVDGRLVAGGAASGQDGSVPADAYASVVVADRNGDVTAVVTSMGRHGGSGRALPGTGVTEGAPLPSACGETLPTVLLQRSPDGRTLSAALAVAPSGSRKAVAESSDPRRSVSAVLGRYGGPSLSAVVSRQRVPLVAVALDQDGSVHAVGLGRTGGSAAVVHDS
jgi:hypothetical protein